MISLSEPILDEATEGEVLDLPTTEAEIVAIGDRLLRELADTRAERDANNAALVVEVQRLKGRFEDINVPLNRRETRLLGYLEQVAQRLPLRGKKSRNLAYGTIGWRSNPRKLVIQDATALDLWIRAQDFDLAASLTRRKTVESVNKDALDALTFKTGEIPNGCELVLPTETFYAKSSEAKDV